MLPDEIELYRDAKRLDAAGDSVKALEAYARYLEGQPEDTEAWSTYGGLLMDLGQLDAARTACDRALALDPKDYAGLVHAAGVLMCQGALEEAEPLLRRALAVDPERLGARLTLADCLIKMAHLNEARSLLEAVLKEQPDCLPALNRLGTLCVLQQDWPRVRQDLERQLVGFSGPEATYRRSHLSLMFGDMPLGWDQFESRLALPDRPYAMRGFSQPRWRGEGFSGKTLLIHWEQGFGDTLMFLRFAPLVKALGGRVLLEVQPQLAGLAATCPGIDEVIPHGADLPPFDLQVPLLSLPAIFRTDLASIPSAIPYLNIPERVPNHGLIAEALAASVGRIRIGVAWAGSSLHSRDTKRSMPTQALAPLADWAGVAWHSFQLDTQDLPPLPDILSLAPLLSDFSDTAYALSGMDLVITVDTALAHLAGALGIPTFLLVSFIPDWRWMLGREDSPWYPTVQLFRQAQPGDWTTAIRQINAQLNSLSEAASDSPA